MQTIDLEKKLFGLDQAATIADALSPLSRKMLIYNYVDLYTSNVMKLYFCAICQRQYHYDFNAVF